MGAGTAWLELRDEKQDRSLSFPVTIQWPFDDRRNDSLGRDVLLPANRFAEFRWADLFSVGEEEKIADGDMDHGLGDIDAGIIVAYQP